MVKIIKKIEATNEPLKKEDETKINQLLKTYNTGKVEFYSSFSGMHSQNEIITTIEEMKVLLTSDSVENLEMLEKEFETKLKEKLGDKVRISTTNKIYAYQESKFGI